MSILNEISVKFVDALVNAVGPIGANFWNILFAFIVIGIGFIVGKIVSLALKEVLLKLKVDKYVRIKQEEIRLSNIFPEITAWIVYLLFISASLEQFFGLGILADAALYVATFLPGLLVAIVVVAFGYVFARYVEDIVKNSRFAYSGIMSKVFFFFVVYIAIIIGVNALNATAGVTLIDVSILEKILLIIVGSFGFGFAIAMGLGLKDMFKGMSDELGKNMLKGLKKMEKKGK
jgi:hypothetical protein